MLLENHFLADSAAAESSSDVRFAAALLKVASRCNLNCDYCYVYKHEDQSWRDQPHFMSDATLRRFGERLSEYVRLHALAEFSVTFHGGEPLLFGGERLANAVRLIRSIVEPTCELDFSIQTNGTLLTDEVLDQLEQAGILISLSIDGDRAANDLHRLDHGGKSTFDLTHAAISRLTNRSSLLFRGVIAVVDTAVAPRDLFNFFAPLNLPKLDLLLPDATYVRRPPGRDQDTDRYLRWLNEAYELWFREYPSLPIRWFDAILASRLGVPSPTDAMGLGSVSLIVIDTDGSYTDHDVFKITRHHGPALNCDLETSSFEEVSRHAAVLDHARRLTLKGLAVECKACPVVEACGGGSVMHRWHPTRGLDAPSIYCRELFGLLETSSMLLREELGRLRPQVADDAFPLQGVSLVKACERWRHDTESRADACAADSCVERNGASAAAVHLWSSHRGEIDAPLPVNVHTKRRWMNSVNVQSSETWLVRPFEDSIRVLPDDSDEIEVGMQLLGRAEELLRLLDPSLPAAIKALISDVVLVASTIEGEDQIFSFSDDSAPNVLYIAPFVSGKPLEVDDFTDSILHEFQHHLLYHLEREGRLLFDPVFPHFPAPWRSGLRPAGGFFHGTFVFAGLSRFWDSLVDENIVGLSAAKALANRIKFREQATYGIRSLRQFAMISPRGISMLDELSRLLEAPDEKLTAPGARV